MRPVAFLAFFAAGLALLASLSLGARADGPETGPCRSPGWLFFDLGNTLVDTHDWNNLRYFPETRAYLAQARKLGYHLGIITNVPEAWGKTAAEKIAHLKVEIQTGWRDGAAFDWSIFEDILVPLSDAERKPAPALYQRAMDTHPDCPLYYEGEDEEEGRVADHIGLENYLVGVPGMPFYMPLTNDPWH